MPGKVFADGVQRRVSDGPVPCTVHFTERSLLVQQSSVLLDSTTHHQSTLAKLPLSAIRHPEDPLLCRAISKQSIVLHRKSDGGKDGLILLFEDPNDLQDFIDVWEKCRSTSVIPPPSTIPAAHTPSQLNTLSDDEPAPPRTPSRAALDVTPLPHSQWSASHVASYTSPNKFRHRMAASITERPPWNDSINVRGSYAAAHNRLGHESPTSRPWRRSNQYQSPSVLQSSTAKVHPSLMTTPPVIHNSNVAAPAPLSDSSQPTGTFMKQSLANAHPAHSTELPSQVVISGSWNRASEQTFSPIPVRHQADDDDDYSPLERVSSAQNRPLALLDLSPALTAGASRSERVRFLLNMVEETSQRRNEALETLFTSRDRKREAKLRQLKMQLDDEALVIASRKQATDNSKIRMQAATATLNAVDFRSQERESDIIAKLPAQQGVLLKQLKELLRTADTDGVEHPLEPPSFPEATQSQTRNASEHVDPMVQDSAEPEAMLNHLKRLLAFDFDESDARQADAHPADTPLHYPSPSADPVFIGLTTPKQEPVVTPQLQNVPETIVAANTLLPSNAPSASEFNGDDIQRAMASEARLLASIKYSTPKQILSVPTRLATQAETTRGQTSSTNAAASPASPFVLRAASESDFAATSPLLPPMSLASAALRPSPADQTSNRPVLTPLSGINTSTPARDEGERRSPPVASNATNTISTAAAGDEGLKPQPTTQWREVKDPASGKVYYVNRMTKKTTWKRDETDLDVSAGASPTASVVISSPSVVTPSHPDTKPTASAPSVTGWIAKIDAGTGKTYYANATLKKTTWKIEETDLVSAATNPVSVVLPAGWKELKDPQSGKTYYYNKESKQTSWKFPTQ